MVFIKQLKGTLIIVSILFHHVQRAQGMVFRWILILKNVIL